MSPQKWGASINPNRRYRVYRNSYEEMKECSRCCSVMDIRVYGIYLEGQIERGEGTATLEEEQKW